MAAAAAGVKPAGDSLGAGGIPCGFRVPPHEVLGDFVGIGTHT